MMFQRIKYHGATLIKKISIFKILYDMMTKLPCNTKKNIVIIILQNYIYVN